MKRLTFLIFISVLLVGIVYSQGIRDDPRDNDAQPRNERQRRNEPRRNIEPVTIEGTLKLEKGFVAIESGETVYLVPMLNRYIGFISDLKEGTRVSVEGREFRNTILPTKLTIDGKSYDFPANGPNPSFGAPGFDRRQENGPNRRQLEQGRNNPGPERRNFNAPNRRYRPGSGCCR